MKKVIFTCISLTLTTVLLLFACSKDESTGITAGYASQNGGTGNNPNTTGATTSAVVTHYYGSITLATNPADSLTIVNCTAPNNSSYQTMGLTASGKSCIIAFDTIPKQGFYNITTNSSPGMNQATVTFSQNSVNYTGQSGVVKVSVTNNKVKTEITNISCIGAGNPLTVSATIICQ